MIIWALAGLLATGGAAAAQQKAAADIKLFQFQPGTIEVRAGTTVEWTNRDDIEHSVTSGTPNAPAGDFDSGFFTRGGSYAFTFTKPGTYSYFCRRHPSMTASVVVSE